MRINFAQLEYADPDCFFTENQLVLCNGTYKDDMFWLKMIEQPPLHANPALTFKLHKNDHFGAYSLLREILTRQTRQDLDLRKLTKFVVHDQEGNEIEQSEEDQSIVVLSEIHLDKARQFGAIEKLLEGLEMMQPRIVVMIGALFSDKNVSTATLQGYLENFGDIIRQNNYVNLREHTEWIFIPSQQDPGQPITMPMFPLSESLLNGFRGKNLPRLDQKIKNVRVGTNPLRISFMGKEITICRFNFLEKFMGNNLARIGISQSECKQKEENYKEISDTERVVNTIVKQGFLMPFAEILQPLIWAYAMDSMSLTPTPDYLVLADECKDYYH